MSSSRVVRLLIVTALAAVAQLSAPLARAVSPPEIDDKWLPPPALPAPPRPTVQREACATPASDPGPERSRLPLSLDELPRVWQLVRGAGQRVAVIDTGVSRHPRLRSVVPGGDYVSTGDGTQDCDAHGTVVAEMVAAAAQPETDDFSGVAPEATVIGIRQSSAKFAPATDRSAAGTGDVDTMAKAIRTAADLGASVITISSVACVPVAAPPDDRAVGAALAYAVDIKNVVVVTAAGNTGGTGQCPAQRAEATWQTATVAVSPAWYDDYVLTVGSVNRDGMPSPFTLPGPWVDVAAPGEAVTALGSEPVSGTGYSAALVSGLAALVRARFPTLTARQVMGRLTATAHHPPAGRDALVGHGTVDALAAVSTDALPPRATPQPRLPVAVPQPTRTRDTHARATALRGAGFCLVVLLGTLAARAATARLRASRHRVPGD